MGTVIVCAIGIYVAYIRFSRTLVDIWCNTNNNLPFLVRLNLQCNSRYNVTESGVGNHAWV